MLNEGPLEEMHPRLCENPCRLTGLKRRHELNEHLVDRIEQMLRCGRYGRYDRYGRYGYT